MTLIIGLNLSDKLYLAADTRATDQKGNHFDNVIKIAHLVTLRFHKIDKQNIDKIVNEGYISVAVAGNIRLASFIYKNIQESIQSRSLSSDIRELYDSLDEPWSIEMANKWLDSGNKYEKTCCLMFAGTFSDRPKQVSIPRVNELMEIYEKNRKVSNVNLPADQVNLDDIIMIPSQFVDATMNEGLISDLPDSLLFCIEIGIYRGKHHFKKVKAEWGEFIARGSNGITENKLPPEILARCEFLFNRNDKNSAEILSGTIREFAQKFNTIGNKIIINAISKDKTMLFKNQKDYMEKDGKTYFKNEAEEWVEAVTFLDYLSQNKSCDL